MSTTKHDRRSVMDLTPALLLAHSTKSAIPISEKSTATASAVSQHSRRSSIPHILDIASSALGLAKRSPLAPLDIQRRSSLSNYEPSSSALLAAMAIGEDEKPSKQSSNTISAQRSSRQPQRTVPKWTLQSTNQENPSIHLYVPAQPDHDPTLNQRGPYFPDDDIYSGLSTFTFGDAHPKSFGSSFKFQDENAAISPLQRMDPIDLTPRPSLARTIQQSNGWSSASEDDEERKRHSRAKMRAIDDGARRPSLPANDRDSTIPAHRSSPKSGTMSSPNKGKARADVPPSSTSIYGSSPPSSHDMDPTDRHSQSETDTSFDFSDDDDVSDQDMDDDKASVHTFGDGSAPTSRQSFSYNEHNRDDIAPFQDHRYDGMDFAREWVDYQGRRNSQPINIPAPKSSTSTVQGRHHLSEQSDSTYPPGLDTQSILSMRRPSRSVDEDLMEINLHKAASRGSLRGRRGSSAHVASSSEPDIRGLAFAQAQEARNSSVESQAQQEFDLNYILDGAGFPPSILEAPGIRKSVSNGLIPSRERENSWTMGWGISGRRQSTATVDDTFLKYVKKNDPLYEARRREWSFARERAEGEKVGLGPGERGNAEIWRCLWVGRYKVERTPVRNSEQAPRVRLSVKHIPDPHSKGNINGGPGTIIHKHSRAQALSIHRGHLIPEGHLKTGFCILLAPKKVQERYTSTRTTSKLSTHGLLKEGEQPRPSRNPSAQHSRSTEPGSEMESGSLSRTKSQPRSERHHERNGRSDDTSHDRHRVHAHHVTGESSQTSSIAGTTTDSRSDTRSSTEPAETQVTVLSPDHFRPAPHPPKPNSATASSSKVSYNSSSSGSQGTSLTTFRGLTPNSSGTRGRTSVASLEDQPLVRTSHAEAFATLDPSSLEHLRAGHELPYEQSSPSRLKGLRKLFQPQNVKSAPRYGVPNHTLESNFVPPWLTMAARSKQEEQERVIKNLNDSFRDVGLLPTYPQKHKQGKYKLNMGKKRTENVFDLIPEDSLYMLLPMWPGETMMGHYTDGDAGRYSIPLHERQYLLVYYVPFVSKEDTDSKPKKGGRQSQTGSSSSHHSDSVTVKDKTEVALKSFNILARLVSHADVNGSGVRLPSTGLAVNGPLSEAMRSIPRIRWEADDLAPIIGFCDKREHGVEFLPEAAEKLGLCVPRLSNEPDPDAPDAPLTPLGQAAIEMAWLGALAVMGFSTSDKH